MFEWIFFSAAIIFSKSIVSLLAPFRAPDSLFAHSSNSTTLIVKWNHLSEEDFQGQPFGYNITFYSVDSQSKVNFFTVNYTKNVTTMTKLTVYTTYVINVSAVSSGGVGPANTARAQTGAAGMDGYSVLERKS